MLLIILLVITGCNNYSNEEIVNYDYIKENKGRVCNDYAVALINSDVETETGGHLAVYKGKGFNDYQKLFDTGEWNFFGNIITTDKNIYFIYTGESNGVKLSSYSLNGNHEKKELEGKITNNIYNIEKGYGIKDNYIYFSYRTWENRLSNEFSKTSYAKLSSDLKELIEIKKADIPKVFDYKSC